MDTILIWGCGKLGQQICRHLVTYWKEEVKVIGYVDSNYELYQERLERGENLFETFGEIKEIYSVSELIKMHEKGTITHCLIAVSDYWKKNIRQNLDVMHIPVWEFPIPQMQSVFDFDNRRVYKNEYCELCEGNFFLRCDFGIDKCDEHRTYWLYDSNGNACLESFNYNDFEQQKNNFHSFFPFNFNDVIEIDDEVCVLSRTYTERNYAHFVYEVLSKICILEKCNYRGKYILAANRNCENSFGELVELIGLRDDRIIWVKPDCSNGAIYHSKKMIIFPVGSVHDIGMMYPLINLYERIKEKIENKCDNMHYPEKIFVKRIGSRKMIGCEEILEKYGFTIMTPERYSVFEQISFFYHSKIVICPHGANCSNVLFMREGTCFIECFDSGYVSDYFWNIYKIKKLKYQMLVAPNQYDNFVFERDTYCDYKIPDIMLENAIKNSIALLQ